jgi:hypothetical protein
MIPLEGGSNRRNTKKDSYQKGKKRNSSRDFFLGEVQGKGMRKGMHILV